MTQTMRDIFAVALIVLCTPFCGATCDSQACLITTGNEITPNESCCGISGYVSCESGYDFSLTANNGCFYNSGKPHHKLALLFKVCSFDCSRLCRHCVGTLCSIAFLISYWLAGTCCTASSDTDDTTSLIVGLVFFVVVIAGIVGGIILACFCCKCCCWKEQQPHFQQPLPVSVVQQPIQMAQPIQVAQPAPVHQPPAYNSAAPQLATLVPGQQPAQVTSIVPSACSPAPAPHRPPLHRRTALLPLQPHAPSFFVKCNITIAA